MSSCVRPTLLHWIRFDEMREWNTRKVNSQAVLVPQAEVIMSRESSAHRSTTALSAPSVLRHSCRLNFFCLVCPRNHGILVSLRRSNGLVNITGCLQPRLLASSWSCFAEPLHVPAQTFHLHIYFVRFCGHCVSDVTVCMFVRPRGPYRRSFYQQGLNYFTHDQTQTPFLQRLQKKNEKNWSSEKLLAFLEANFMTNELFRFLYVSTVPGRMHRESFFFFIDSSTCGCAGCVSWTSPDWSPSCLNSVVLNFKGGPEWTSFRGHVIADTNVFQRSKRDVRMLSP